MDLHYRSILLSAIIALSFVALSNAAYVNITEPYNATVLQNGSIYLGKVGPGQTFYVTISAATANSSGSGINLGWNELNVTALPGGWLAQNSPPYTQFPSAKITVAPQAANGTYEFNLTAINIGNYSKVGSVRFTAYVNVTPDVFKLGVTPVNLTAAPGAPAYVYVTINNTGVSDSPFNITVHGLPAWNRSVTVIALHHTEGKFVYPIYENEPGRYDIQLYVSSIASPLIYKQSSINFVTKATIANDYAALGQGALTFPIIYAPVYAVMYLIHIAATYA